MGKATLLVSAEIFDQIRQDLLAAGVEPLAKEGFDKSSGAYYLGIQGLSVPNAKLVNAEFTRTAYGVSVEFKVTEP